VISAFLVWRCVCILCRLLGAAWALFTLYLWVRRFCCILVHVNLRHHLMWFVLLFHTISGFFLLHQQNTIRSFFGLKGLRQWGPYLLNRHLTNTLDWHSFLHALWHSSHLWSASWFLGAILSLHHLSTQTCTTIHPFVICLVYPAEQRCYCCQIALPSHTMFFAPPSPIGTLAVVRVGSDWNFIHF
jgi:hypothetical protein